MDSSNFIDKCAFLRVALSEDAIGVINANHRTVRRDDVNLDAVELLELVGRRLRRSGHAAETRIESQKMLQGH